MKYFEIADFHFSPKWKEFSEKMGLAVALQAEKHQVDLISITGDFFDGPIYANDKGGLKSAKSIVKRWLDICPVVAIEGTPSHDAPGCYGIFEEMGLVLLRPGQVYGYYRDRHIKSQKRLDVSLLRDDVRPNSLLFGIPELNKKTIQAQLNLPAEQANAAAEQLLKEYVADFIGPNRAKYPDIPAIGLIHGNLSDSHRTNETDIILKASDIVIHTEDLRAGDLDRWSAGHIHTPWESGVISCGYAGFPGMDANPWGKRDFYPAFNMVEIHGKNSVSLDRLAYGSPQRCKVSSVDQIEPAYVNTAWWVETDDRDAKLPEGLHPWSRLTIKETAKETRRVSQEEAADVKSLWDLFCLIDPTIPVEYKAKVDEITETIKPPEVEKKDVIVSSVEIAGSLLFKEKTVKFDLSSLSEGLTLITGENGDGKSSLLSFCHPYPVVIGKDTKSGRDSAIKDFFSGRDSYIKKTVYKNGIKHDHLLTIKGAHTKNPKAECYFTIDGEPQLDKGTFDEMMAMCETQYGSLHDYRITTFCEQPNQAAANLSGLMSAKPIDARNIVQAIAGVDRDRERRYALDKVSECQTEAETLILRADAKEEFLVDETEIADQIEAKKAVLREIADDMEKVKEAGAANKTAFDEATSEAEEFRRKEQLSKEAEEARHEVDRLDGIISGLPANELRIKRDDEARAEKDIYLSGRKEYDRLSSEYYQKKNGYDSARREIETQLKSAIDQETICREEILNGERAVVDLPAAQKDLDNKRLEEEITENLKEISSNIGKWKAVAEALNKPCEFCGKIGSADQEKLDSLTGMIETAEAEREELKEKLEKIGFIDKDIFTLMAQVETLTSQASVLGKNRELLNLAIMSKEKSGAELAKLVEPIKPTEPPPYLGAEPMTQAERDGVSAAIAEARQASTAQSLLKETVTLKGREANAIQAAPDAAARADEFGRLRETLKAQYMDLRVKYEREDSEKGNLQGRLSDNGKLKEEIEELRAKANETGLEAWQYISGMLAANKIPALELDLFLDVIDSEATDCISPFLEGRYAIETLTQEEGKKGLVDRFDIIVHDREECSELSLFSYNPGHKAFFSDAYIKALILQRNQRLQRSYSPVIFDEADSPIKESRIGMYYDINQRYYLNHSSRVLVVSQKDSASAYMAGEVSVNSLKED